MAIARTWRVKREGVALKTYWPDTFITLSVDTAIAAQNVAVVRRKLGLRDLSDWRLTLDCQGLINLLNLPKYTYPIFGLCIGKPSADMRVKPRLPKPAVYFDNQYQAETLPQQLADYEQTMLEFAEKREIKPYRQKFAGYYK